MPVNLNNTKMLIFGMGRVGTGAYGTIAQSYPDSVAGVVAIEGEEGVGSVPWLLAGVGSGVLRFGRATQGPFPSRRVRACRSKPRRNLERACPSRDPALEGPPPIKM